METETVLDPTPAAPESPPLIITGRRRNSALNKLTMERAEAIRARRRADNTSITVLAKEFGVSSATISKVCSGKLYGSSPS